MTAVRMIPAMCDPETSSSGEKYVYERLAADESRPDHIGATRATQRLAILAHERLRGSLEPPAGLPQ